MSSQMMNEIEAQGEAWRDAVEATRSLPEALRAELRSRTTRFVGAGSSFYLGNVAAVAWRQAGLAAESVPASEPLLHASAYLWPGHVAFGVSRSGSTTETVTALTRARQAGAYTVAITTRQGTPIQRAAHHTVVLERAAEQATVQTRSFAGQLLAALAIGLDAAGAPTSERATAWTARSEELIDAGRAAAHGVDPRSWTRAYFLGTGPLFGAAQEGALKMKESALTEAEAFQTLEFRHGPKSMIDDETLIVGLVSDAAEEAERAVLNEARQLGAHVLTASTRPVEAGQQASYLWGDDVPTAFHPVAALPLLHHLAHARAAVKGIDPDHPRHLSFAVELDDI